VASNPFVMPCMVDDGTTHGTIQSIRTLPTCSTQKQRCSCLPVLTIVCFHRILQLCVFVCSPATIPSCHAVGAGIQFIMPSIPTLQVHSTWDERSNYLPILFCVCFYRIFQLVVFFWCPATRTPCVQAQVNPGVPLTCPRNDANACQNSLEPEPSRQLQPQPILFSWRE
jgi:hypothetical protein